MFFTLVIKKFNKNEHCTLLEAKFEKFVENSKRCFGVSKTRFSDEKPLAPSQVP